MDAIQNTREKDLERAELLLEKAMSKVEIEEYEPPTVALLKEAMELFERWGVKEKVVKIYEYWARYQNYAGNSQASIAYAQKNLNIYLELYGEEHIEVAKSYYNLHLNHAYFNFEDAGMDYLNKAFNVSQKISKGNNIVIVSCYISFARVQTRLGNYLASIDLLQKALAIIQKLPDKDKDIDTLLAIYNNIGNDYRKLGNYHQLYEYLHLALETIEKSAKPHKRALHYIYSLSGHLYFIIGDYQKAYHLYQKSITVWKVPNINTSVQYHSLSVIAFTLNDYSKTIAYNQIALEIIEERQVRQSPDLCGIYLYQSLSYSKLGESGKALSFLQKALKAAILAYGKGQHTEEGKIYIAFGKYYATMGRFAKAKSYFEKSLAIFQTSKYTRPMHFFDLWHKWGNLFLLQKPYLKAIDYYHKALRSYFGDSLSEDKYAQPSLISQVHTGKIKGQKSYHNLMAVLYKKARAFQEHYKIDNQNIKDLEAAHQTYWTVIRLADHLRQSFLSEQSKLIVAKTLQKPLEGAVAAAYLYFETIPSNQHLEHLFLLMEKGKANLLLMHSQEKRQQKNLGIPSKLLEQERQLKRKLALIEKGIQFQEQKGERAEKELLKQWKEEAFDVYNQFEQLKEQLERDYPDYHRQNYSTDTVSILDLQSSLQANQTVLNYFTGENKIYLFAITADEYEVFAIDKPSNWTALIQNHLQSIKFHQKAQFLRYSFALYQILLQEVIHYLIDPFAEEDEQRQIFIIPHAELHYLPFETLIVSEADESTVYKDLDYLLKNCQISYHYSATLLHLDLQKQAESLAERAPMDVAFMGFAPVYTSSSNAQKQALELLQQEYAETANRSEAARSDGTWMPLPYSKLEVENIAQLFDKQGLQSQTFLYESANKSNLEEQIGKSRFVLIAAHGIVNNQYPELSGLVLASSYGTLVANERKVSKYKSETTKDLEFLEADRDKIELQKATDDCILNMKEVAMIPMNADLVVLSSCESGIGELQKGEGMMAVNRGFLASGAKNVVSTLFKVNDKASSELTTLLFGYILEGESYSTALQKAKLELLQRQGMSPKMWSGFVLFGVGA